MRYLNVAVLVLGTLLPMRRGAEAQEKPLTIAVIVANDSPLRDISLAELRRIFLTESTKVDGVEVVPLALDAGHRTRIAFDRALLGLEPEAVSRLWIDRKIRGQARPPRSFPSPTLLRSLVAKHAEVIAYVPLELVTPEVRALQIDGKLPTQIGYPLRPEP